MNVVHLIGNVGKDSEIRTLESGVKIASFSLATTKRFKDKDGNRKDQTQWHNIVLWRGLAEVAEKYVKKGDKLQITGEVTYRSWDDKEGVKKYATDIVGSNMEMLGTKGTQENKQEESKPAQQEAPIGEGEEPLDLPF